MKILNGLQDWERLTVADALESVSFEKGDCIGKLNILFPLQLQTSANRISTDTVQNFLYFKISRILAQIHL